MRRPTRKLYYSTSFTGRWPVGTAAVVWATSPGEASDILNIVLVRDYKLKPTSSAEHMVEFKKDKGCEVLQEGEY